MIDVNFISQLQYKLEHSFYFGFEIDLISQDVIRVRPSGSNLELFNLEVKLKRDIRLTIELHPDKYSAEFVNILSQSSIEQRERFIAIWEQIGYNLITLTINNQKINKEDFLIIRTNWSDFEIKFTKAPLIVEDIEIDFVKNNPIYELTFNYINDVITMILSLVNFEIEGFSEGKVSRIEINKYERNPVNRRICLMAKGYKCAVCDFDFQKTYGNIGRDYIEVHHIRQVSEIGENYTIKPLEDLVPVCSNCHSMIHRTKPMLSIDDLKKEYIYRNKST